MQINLIVMVAPGTMFPICDSDLPQPTQLKAEFTDPSLSVKCTIQLPSNVQSVTVYQLHESGTKTLIYTVTFTTDGPSARPASQSISWSAIPHGNIVLEDIGYVEVFLHQDDPKTSRGTRTSVGHAGDTEEK